MNEDRSQDAAASRTRLTLLTHDSIADVSTPIAVGARVPWLWLMVWRVWRARRHNRDSSLDSQVCRELRVAAIERDASGHQQCGNANKPHSTPPVQSGICVTLNPEYPA